MKDKKKSGAGKKPEKVVYWKRPRQKGYNHLLGRPDGMVSKSSVFDVGVKFYVPEYEN